MANAGDEQQRERQRQQRELEEIRRNFAETGARTGSLFEPAEPEEPERSPRPLLPPAPPVAASSPLGILARSRWWWAAALTLLFLVGGLFGWLLRGDGALGAPAEPDHRGCGGAAPGPAGDGDPDQDQRARGVPRHGQAGRRGHRPSDPQPA